MSNYAAFDGHRAIELARMTLQLEAECILELIPRLDNSFSRAVEEILVCQGRVITTGVGKSGKIAQKIASTFSSTGTPAFYVHPTEAAHGDLGMITAADLALVISLSGESDEIARILPALSDIGLLVVAITAGVGSRLAKAADIVLDCTVRREACPFNLAPTTSTTLQLALGDALAVSTLDARGFSEDKFASLHPGGALGKRLTDKLGSACSQKHREIATLQQK